MTEDQTTFYRGRDARWWFFTALVLALCLCELAALVIVAIGVLLHMAGGPEPDISIGIAGLVCVMVALLLSIIRDEQP